MEEEKTDIVVSPSSPSRGTAAGPYKRLLPGGEVPILDSHRVAVRRVPARSQSVPNLVKDEPMEGAEGSPPVGFDPIVQAQMMEIMHGQNASMAEVDRLPGEQRNTEKSAVLLLSEINTMMEQLKERQMELNQRSIDMEHGVQSQSQNTQRLEQESLRRDKEILRRTEQAFGRTEDTIRQIPDLLQRVLRGQVRNLPRNGNAVGRDVSMGVPTMGLPPAGGLNLDGATAVQSEPMALAYVPINVSDPPKYQSDRYELYREEV